MELPRIYADFNGLEPGPRDNGRLIVPLDTWGSLCDLSNLGIRLREGLRLLIHSDSDEVEDLEATTTVYYDPERRWWYAEVEGEVAYVPAHDRDIRPFRCLGCRAGLEDAVVGRPPHLCPHCGTSTHLAIAPPATE